LLVIDLIDLEQDIEDQLHETGFLTQVMTAP